MTRFHRLSALILLLVAPFAQAADEGWRLEKDQGGIQIYTRAVEGYKIREIRGVVRVQAPVSAVAAMLADPAVTPQISETVSLAKVLRRQGAQRSQIYQVLDMPWPLDDRDIVVQREIRQDPKTYAVVIADSATPDAAPAEKGRVRVQKSRTQWTLTPQADGTVETEMRALTDPNGPIPASVINSMSVGVPFKSLDKLRTLAQQPKYRQGKLDFIKEAPR